MLVNSDVVIKCLKMKIVMEDGDTTIPSRVYNRRKQNTDTLSFVILETIFNFVYPVFFLAVFRMAT